MYVYMNNMNSNNLFRQYVKSAKDECRAFT